MRAALLLTNVLILAVRNAQGAADKVNPIQKALELIGGLQAKVIHEGEESQKIYDEAAEACEDRSKDLHFAIKTAKGQIEDLDAVIRTESAKVEALDAKIERSSSEMDVDEKDLAAAQAIRDQEMADFQVEEKDLAETIDVIRRAITVLEKESSLVQLKSTGNIVEALAVVVQGTAFNTADRKRLTSLVQTASLAKADDAEDMDSAPDPYAYESHSGGVVEILQGILDRAEEQINAARTKETSEEGNFRVMAQTLNGEIAFSMKEIAEAKKERAESQEAGATAKGDLSETTAHLAKTEEVLDELHQDCMVKARDFEEETKSRAEELKALATAKSIIEQALSGEGTAEEVQYGLNQEAAETTQGGVMVFAQMGAHSRQPLQSHVLLQAVRFFRDLARKKKSPALAQLAIRTTELLRGRATDIGLFDKVKGLIRDLLDKLIKDAEQEASHKSYCDKELAYTTGRKEDKDDEIAKLAAKIAKMSARSAQLKKEVAELDIQLRNLHQTQMQMDNIRVAEETAYSGQRAATEEGIQGVKAALKVLKDYYGSNEKFHDAAEGAGSGIIGILEVIESDFMKTLQDLIVEEEAAVEEHKRMSKENQVLKASLEQDLKYKAKESSGLDRAVAEDSSDKDSVQSELNAVLEDLSNLMKMCGPAQAESYEARVRRREAEVAGLREGLQILNGEALAAPVEAVLLQERSVRRLRGTSADRREAPW